MHILQVRDLPRGLLVDGCCTGRDRTARAIAQAAVLPSPAINRQRDFGRAIRRNDFRTGSTQSV
jgi:hypothetical protein